MVQIIKMGPSRTGRLAEALGQSLGQGLNEFTGSYFANRDLERVLSDKSLEDKNPYERLSALETALRPHGERGQKIFQNRLQLEQQREQEIEQNVLAKISQGKEVSEKEFARLSPQNQMKVVESQKKSQQGKSIRDVLIKAGYPEETAQLWAQQFEVAPQGGQTDVIENVNELIRRSKSGKGLVGEEEPKNTLKPSIQIPGLENKEYQLDFPDLKQSVGRTSADIVKEETEHRKINTPVYAETIDRLNALDEDYRDLNQLQEYNLTPGALPAGIRKWNVNWDTGDLRFKALGTPEAQAYVKTVSRMLNKAKEFFPGRVTNFDLEQFKNQFPTLANSPEGRTLINNQLMLANRIGYLKDETLKAAIDHYGSEGDPVQIKRFAQENYRRLKGQLEGELKGLNQQAQNIVEKEGDLEKPSLEEIFG